MIGFENKQSGVHAAVYTYMQLRRYIDVHIPSQQVVTQLYSIIYTHRHEGAVDLKYNGTLLKENSK